MSSLLRAALLAALVFSAAPAHAVDLHVELSLSGGTLMEWDAPDEAGNAYGLGVGLSIDQNWRASIHVAGVAPDSRAQGIFEVFWAEGTWLPWRFHHIAPYLSVGLGVATQDTAPEPRPGEIVPVRWSPEGAQFVGMMALGARYGPPDSGLFLAVDLRAYNITHGGVVVSAGWRF